MELTQGQNILSQEIAAFAFWTLRHYNKSTLQTRNFLSYLQKFDFPHLTSPEKFISEFQYLIMNSDLRLWNHNESAGYWNDLNKIWGSEEECVASELGIEWEELKENVDLENSVLSYDLFRTIFVERDL